MDKPLHEFLYSGISSPAADICRQASTVYPVLTLRRLGPFASMTLAQGRSGLHFALVYGGLRTCICGKFRGSSIDIGTAVILCGRKTIFMISLGNVRPRA